MNNILLILGMLALSNGDLSLLDNNKTKQKKTIKKSSPSKSQRQQKVKSDKETHENTRGVKKVKKIKKRNTKSSLTDMLNFNINDLSQGMKLMDLSDDDLERGMEIITRTKKYMSSDERKLLIRVESVLDLVRGIKKLTAIEMVDTEMESEFFRDMEEEDKKNMMIKEIIEVFPEKKKESVTKAISMKKKIDLFAELFLPDDFGEGGFSLSSLANLGNLGSASNLKLLGSLLRGAEDNSDDEYYDEYEDIKEGKSEYKHRPLEEDYYEEDDNIYYEEDIDY